MAYENFRDFAADIELFETATPLDMTIQQAHDLLSGSQRWKTPLSSALLALISAVQQAEFPDGWRVSWVRDGREYRLIAVRPGRELPPNDGEHD